MAPILLDLAYAVAALVAAPWLLRKRRLAWGERAGRVEPLPPARRTRIVLHAVSVGEVNLVRRLVPLLAERFDVVVTATTDTGIARARALYGASGPGVHVRRYPLDFSWAVNRFLEAVRPDVVGLVELELWPNFLGACRRRGVAVCVLNGRLSDRSFGRYRRFGYLFRGWFGRLAFVAAQDEVYAGRFRLVGAPADRVVVAGSMKWDAADVADTVPGADDLAREMGIDRSRPLIVAGSTAPDEHALLHAAAPAGAQLLCAPRRPEWFDDAARELPGCVRRSAGAARPGADRFLLDTIGELRKAYALADVAVVGRSFGGLFGSDPMEPAALGKPVVIGPAVDDFRAPVDALRAAGGLLQVTRDGVSEALSLLLSDARRREEMARAARSCVVAHQGATARHAELLCQLADRRDT